ncbi:MAG TPA: hypothetical protein VFQ92_12475 [Blastocatellia bacterium]|nr:hypothetical protein [Blastocatellia bacterium]
MEQKEGSSGEVTFDDLQARDEVLIQTKNNQYRFVIIDPAEKRGLLSGGSLRNRQREAILVGTLAENTRSFAIESPVIRAGERVLFCLIDGNEAENFFTTGIQRLAHLRESNGRHVAAASGRGRQG